MTDKDLVRSQQREIAMLKNERDALDEALTTLNSQYDSLNVQAIRLRAALEEIGSLPCTCGTPKLIGPWCGPCLAQEALK